MIKNNLSYKKSIFAVLIVGCVIICVIGWGIKKYSHHLSSTCNESTILLNSVTSPREISHNTLPIVERVVTTAQLWRSIQEQIKDTVVQIIAHVSCFDFMQPFKSPIPVTGSGSGFFINSTGEIITNFHVVNQAKSLWIQIPSLGKRILDAHVIGISPERDIALLRLVPESLALVEKELGGVPYLPLGDSDLVHRSDEALAVGYPLGQRSIKSTAGVISGREAHYIQTDAPLNPGNSGGPLLNSKGEVIGINCSGCLDAQNVGYAIPINDLKPILADLHTIKILRKPFLGLIFNAATETLTSEYLKNPLPGGCYVADVIKGSTLDRAGIVNGDMIYAINGHSIDMFAEMNVPWSEDKISLFDFILRLSVGETLTLIVYRRGVKKTVSAVIDVATVLPIRTVYPGFEAIDYEVFGGFVAMQLTKNHIDALRDKFPGLIRYNEFSNQSRSVVIMTHIFPNSQLFRAQVLVPASTIHEINGVPVTTLDELRSAIKKSFTTNILTIRASDNVTRVTENFFVALDWEKILEEEINLSRDFKYSLTPFTQEIMCLKNAQKELAQKKLK